VLEAALVSGAYLLGAVPFGLLIGRAHGIDIRTQGSRNIGATNVGRVVGRKWGILCLLLDILKGLVPTVCATLLLHTPIRSPLPLLGERLGEGALTSALNSHHSPQQQLIVLLVAVAAVLGHVFPIYLRFRGGKGVATTIGVTLGVWPYYTFAMLAALIAYLAVRYATGKVSAGSITLAIVFPAAFVIYTRVTDLALGEHWPLLAVAFLLAGVIIVRHRENIRRLLHGEEMGVVERGPQTPSQTP